MAKKIKQKNSVEFADWYYLNGYAKQWCTKYKLLLTSSDILA